MTNISAGLTSLEIDNNLKRYGYNSISTDKKTPLLKKFIEQISSFLMILLIGAALISFFIGDTVDGILILLIIFLNAVFGIFQEYKAEQAVQALKKLTIATVRVIRNHTEQEIDSTRLVPGDIVLVEEGSKVPADAVVIKSINLELNEASLTGESFSVVKTASDEVFMGTIIAKGRATLEVTKTGMKTKFGEIALRLASVKEPPTPLQTKISRITELIGLLGIVLSFIVFILSTLQGYGYFPSFLLGISLAVAVVPESLPAVMTVILSVGVKHMAGKKAIVRRLAAIEAIGSTTLIATDKTGTLTTNKMAVSRIFFNGEDLDFKKLSENSTSNKFNKTLEMILINGIICSTAALVNVLDGDKKKKSSALIENDYEVLGDPTEGALLLAARDMGFDPNLVRQNSPIIDENSFDSVRKRMSVIARYNEDKLVFAKGAPESILQICNRIEVGLKIVEITSVHKKQIEDKLASWADSGLRVIAFSMRDATTSTEEKNHIFLGLAAISDPLRPEAKKAIERATLAGIKVVMITGDNERTAEAIGVEIGLMKKGDIVMRGAEIEEYSDQELLKLLPHTKIFARTNPFHKSRIVSLYQKLGEVVSVTGDGVNDAIAIKQADVGIAMGRIGTDVARETADMVIVDDNFATIVNAVEEGRNIVNRLKNSIKYLLTGNLSEGLTILVGLMLGLPYIFLPIQLLYINLISDGLPALALAFSPKDENIMRGKQIASKHILSSKDLLYIASVGTSIMAIVLFAYIYLAPGEGMQSRTMAFFVMAIIQAFIFVDIWLSHKRIIKNLHIFKKPIFWATIIIPFILQYIIVSTPILAAFFHVNTLSLSEFAYYSMVASSVILVIPVVKYVFTIK